MQEIIFLTTPALMLFISTNFAQLQTTEDKIRLILTILSIPLATFSLLFTIGFWNHIGIGSELSIFHLGITPILLIEYILLSLPFILHKTYIKKGFSEIKKPQERGLVDKLATGFFMGIAITTIPFSVVLLAGKELSCKLMLMINPNITPGTTFYFLTLLTISLSIGLIYGLIQGHINESK